MLPGCGGVGDMSMILPPSRSNKSSYAHTTFLVTLRQPLLSSLI